MLTLHGRRASNGVAFGKLVFFKRDIAVPERNADDAAAQLRQFEEARRQAVQELAQLAAETKQALGEENSLLFHIHKMMLEDVEYTRDIVQKIKKQHMSAAYAVRQTAEEFAARFAEMDDEYLRGRAADVQDISNRVINIIMGRRSGGLQSDEPCIVAADDLAPSETAQLDRDKVLAFVTAGGSGTTHTAIFARTLGLPAVIGLGEALLPLYEGRQAIVDGENGTVYIDPTAEIIAQMEQRKSADAARAAQLAAFSGKPTETRSGRRVALCANIGSPLDVPLALQNGAEGVGLFRSEYLFLERGDYPDEETQLAAYSEVLRTMSGRRVVIRTLDIGADKEAAYFNLPKEENPALGMRAVRLCLTRPELFKTQLRALYRASVHGRLAILLPMIISVQEVRRCQELCAEVRAELQAQGIAYSDNVELGVMIETPAAAVTSDLLAPLVDFFSIGTNDLTQYTFACDRQNPALAPFCDVNNPALARLIQYTVKSAHRAGIWVGVCGELAADEAFADRFLAMGVDELSVAPAAILSMRAHIARLD